MINKTFEIKGMHCASCATIITNKISKLTGVNTININVATEKAVVSFDGAAVSTQQMNNEIEKLGYTFVDENRSNTKEEHSI